MLPGSAHANQQSGCAIQSQAGWLSCCLCLPLPALRPAHHTRRRTGGSTLPSCHLPPCMQGCSRDEPTFSGTRHSQPTCTIKTAASSHMAVMHSTTQHSSAQLARQCALQPAAAVGPRAHSPAATVVPVAACCLHRHQRACIVGMRHAAWVGTRQPAVRLRHTEPSRLVELLPMPPLTCSSPCPSHAPQDWRQYPSQAPGDPCMSGGGPIGPSKGLGGWQYARDGHLDCAAAQG